jgi:hypothetical protein
MATEISESRREYLVAASWKEESWKIIKEVLARPVADDSFIEPMAIPWKLSL